MIHVCNIYVHVLMLVVLYMCIPFKEESERNKEYGGCGLSIEDKDEIVHAMVKCSLRAETWLIVN